MKKKTYNFFSDASDATVMPPVMPKNLLIKDEGMRLIVLSCIYAFSFIVLIVGDGESYRIVIVSRACVASMRPS